MAAGPPAQRQQLAREPRSGLPAVRAAAGAARGQRESPASLITSRMPRKAPLAGEAAGERVVLDVAHEGDVAVAGSEQVRPRPIAPAGDVVGGQRWGTSACATSARTVGTPSRCSRALTRPAAAAAR